MSTMMKPKGWDEAPAYTGERKKLPAGGYVCTISGAKAENLGKSDEYLSLAFEIAEGQYKGFFNDSFEQTKKNYPDAKWPCTMRQYVYKQDGTVNGYFKGFVTCVEGCNPGFTWDFNPATLKGKKVGMVFREEEYYRSTDGVLTANTKPFRACSLENVREGVAVPEIKRAEPKAKPAAPFTMQAQVMDDEDLPF